MVDRQHWAVLGHSLGPDGRHRPKGNGTRMSYLSIVISFSIFQVVDESAAPADNPDWFPDGRLNWAQNMLRTRSDKLAIVQARTSWSQDTRPRLISPPL